MCCALPALQRPHNQISDSNLDEKILLPPRFMGDSPGPMKRFKYGPIIVVRRMQNGVKLWVNREGTTEKTVRTFNLFNYVLFSVTHSF